MASKFTDSSGHEHLAASHRQLHGYLMGPEGVPLRTVSTGRSDRLTLLDLLTAAGVQSLDQPSDDLDARGRSFRERGCVLRVTIYYQNWMSTLVGARLVGWKGVWLI